MHFGILWVFVFGCSFVSTQRPLPFDINGTYIGPNKTDWVYYMLSIQPLFHPPPPPRPPPLPPTYYTIPTTNCDYCKYSSPRLEMACQDFGHNNRSCVCEIPRTLPSYTVSGVFIKVTDIWKVYSKKTEQTCLVEQFGPCGTRFGITIGCYQGDGQHGTTCVDNRCIKPGDPSRSGLLGRCHDTEHCEPPLVCYQHNRTCIEPNSLSKWHICNNNEECQKGLDCMNRHGKLDPVTWYCQKNHSIWPYPTRQPCDKRCRYLRRRAWAIPGRNGKNYITRGQEDDKKLEWDEDQGKYVMNSSSLITNFFIVLTIAMLALF